MKKLIILSLIIFGACMHAQGIKFEESNLSTAMAKAEKENKLVFIDAYTSWCGPCKLMAKNIFPLPVVGNYFNDHFISVKIDMEKGEGIEVAKKYKVSSYPTYLFLNSKGEEVHRGLGSYSNVDEFIQVAKDAQDPNRNLSVLKRKFEEGEKDPAFLKNLINLTVRFDADFAVKVFERYSLSSKGQMDKEDIMLLTSNIRSTASPLYPFFKEKKSIIIKTISEEEYNTIDRNIKLSTLLNNFKQHPDKFSDTNFLAEARKFLNKEEAERELSKYKASQALSKKDIATYEKLTLELYKEYSTASPEELNSVAWAFFENVNTKSSLEKAIMWAQESVKKNKSYYNTDTLANLYKKVGDNVQAKKWEEEANALKVSGNY
ncbi:thiol:disulfide interchange protein [Chryseobacterium angstadtii]|uniref:Thiol:disulfide interchange protein n=1 Tax=Chryseobacterium angstadtii TaxID=558151 RepID=A0A0J7L807_9FLAO|nr:thioredoxin family protein [Chryseobacterium angstadtii]KMQ65165.1 thiol:disulfide interchange protein [Chryseobacterium angstadtii]